MNQEQLLQLWTEERKTEYKVTIEVGYEKVTLRKYSRPIGTKEWFPENQVITVSKVALQDAIRE